MATAAYDALVTACLFLLGVTALHYLVLLYWLCLANQTYYHRTRRPPQGDTPPLGFRSIPALLRVRLGTSALRAP